MSNVRQTFTEKFILTFSDNPDTFFERVITFIEQVEQEAESRGYTNGWAASHEHDAGIEKLVQEAREQMKLKCLRCIPDETALSQLDTMAQKDIKEAENNLLWEIKNSISKL